MGQGYFVTGTDTRVGKTLVACALLRAFARTGKSVVGMKPVAAGREGGRFADVEALAQASTVNARPQIVNPYAFEPAIAPHIAAELAGLEIGFDPIAHAYEELSRLAEVVVVEGVGGFLVPLNATQTGADLATRLGLPMVLVVHGGPWARDIFGYRGDHQWLADRGYAVLSVNYRGSTGFGKGFVAASEKEHARKMHNDLIDMVEWAVDEGIAQKDKIAIFGLSYGGLASFVGATFTPEVFCCSVPVVGISNLQTLLESMPPYWAGFAEYMYRSYGDPRTEEGRKLLAERSPINKVENIKKPMLIFHGANDVRCKVAESDTIVAAMQAKNIPVTYVVYPDEGHGFQKPPNRLSFIAIAEAFFARHLGGAFEPVGRDLEGSSHEIRACDGILRDLGVT